jgi:multiple sugar transport system permease protein
LDGHARMWDASPENSLNRYGEGWIECFYSYHQAQNAGLADGYGPTYAFFRVILPLMRPSIIASAVLVFIFAWNEFAFALRLGGRSAETLPVGISQFITPSGVQFGPLAALGTVAVLPVAIMVFVLHKHIVRGLSLGAVKG